MILLSGIWLGASSVPFAAGFGMILLTQPPIPGAMLGYFAAVVIG